MGCERENSVIISSKPKDLNPETQCCADIAKHVCFFYFIDRTKTLDIYQLSVIRQRVLVSDRQTLVEYIQS